MLDTQNFSRRIDGDLLLGFMGVGDSLMLDVIDKVNQVF